MSMGITTVLFPSHTAVRALSHIVDMSLQARRSPVKVLVSSSEIRFKKYGDNGRLGGVPCRLHLRPAA